MKKKGKIIFILMLTFIITIGALVLFINNKNSSFSTSSNAIDNRLEKGSNKLGYGMYGNDNKIIDNGSVLKAEDGKVHSQLSLSNYIDSERGYKIILLNNFKQVSFIANGEKKLNHDFLAKPNTDVNTDIVNKIDENVKEITYLTIKNPGILIETFDPKAASLQQVLSLRYNTKNKNMPFHVNDSIYPLLTSKEGPIDSIFISESKEELNALTSAVSRQNVYLTVGNTGNKIIQYALIALLDWEQVPLINEQFIHYVTVKPNEKNIFNLKLPETATKKNYQVLAFPFPYKVSKENHESQSVDGSIRTVIHPKQTK